VGMKTIFLSFHCPGASLLTRRWVYVYRNLNKFLVPQPDQMCFVGLDSSGSGKDPYVVFCAYSNESSLSIKCGKFLEDMKDSMELIREGM
jgi:hypothetical protein